MLRVMVLFLMTFQVFCQDITPDYKSKVILNLDFDGVLDKSLGAVVKDIKYTTDRNGKENSACLFNGNSSYIKLPDNYKYLKKNNYSIMFWCKAKPSKKGQYSSQILAKYDWGGERSLRISSGKNGSGLLTSIYNTNKNPDHLTYKNKENLNSVNVEDVRLNEWRHYVYTLDENNVMKVYINGKLASSTISNFPMHLSNQPIYIGAAFNLGERPGNLNYFNGALDDLRIFKTSLNECEIWEIYTNELNINLQQLVLDSLNENYSKWKHPKKFETTPELMKRTQDSIKVKHKMEQNIMSYYASKYINWECSWNTYNADKEEFVISNDKIKPINLEVPLENNEAINFDKNFKLTIYSNPKFSNVSVDNKFEVECIEIINSGKRYKVGCNDLKEEIDTLEIKNKLINTVNNYVLIKVWDDGALEDGDIVTLSLNDRIIRKKEKVTKDGVILNIALKMGENKFTIKAINEGKSTPNTAALTILDSNKYYQTKSRLKKGDSSTLVIKRE